MKVARRTYWSLTAPAGADKRLPQSASRAAQPLRVAPCGWGAKTTGRSPRLPRPVERVSCWVKRKTEGEHMDIVFLRGLRIETVIGIYDWEKEIRQPVILDLEMSTDVAKAAASDRIEDAVDYKAVSKRLKQYIGEGRFELVETLAERCADIIRNEFGVRWVRLTVNKIGAVTDANDVGVIIERGERF